MAIEFRCSACEQMLRVPDEAAGRQARCPKCNAMMPIPSGNAEASPPGNFSDFPAAPPKPPESPENPFQTSPTFPPTKPGAADNPFGDRPPQLNPYASPAAADEAYASAFTPGTPQQRPGLPWDDPPRTFQSWKESLTLVMFSPADAFSRMRLWGGIGAPFGFAVIGAIVGYFAVQLWQIPMQILMGVHPLFRPGVDPGEATAAAIGMLVGTVFGLGVCLPIVLIISLSMLSGLQHLAMMMVGAGKNGYEVTFRVNAYAQGAVGWLGIIPIVGQLVSFVTAIVVTTIGLSKAHETTIGKALFAALVPMLLLVGLGIALGVALMLAFSAR